MEFTNHKTSEEADEYLSDRKGKKFERGEGKNEKMEEEKNEHKNDRGFENREELKNVEEIKKYLLKNNPGLMEKFELENYIDSGGESHVYGIQIKTKDKY